MNRHPFVFALLMALGANAPALGQEPNSDPAPTNMSATLEQRAQQVLAVMQGRLPAEQAFAESFRAAVPDAQLTALAEQLVAQNGPLLRVEVVAPFGVDAARIALRYERAVAAGLIQIEQNPPYRVTGFRITAVTPLDDSAQRLLSDFAALPGSSGFGLYRLSAEGPRPILINRPATQFAIGSTFKLWVLEAVADEVAAGNLRWDQVVPLGARSFPSGIMQDWPENAPVTVETLATLMISISDNTATDTLMRLVGREKIAERVIASGHRAPERMLPMLTTWEAFTLKAQTPERISAYAAADRAERTRMLDSLLPAPDVTSNTRPAAIETIEWFASAEDIARVLDMLSNRGDPRILAILGVSPHLPPDAAARFQRIGFKGGSETGVLNLSWLLVGADGQRYVATASWNDPDHALDMQRFELLAMRLIALIPQAAP